MSILLYIGSFEQTIACLTIVSSRTTPIDQSTAASLLSPENPKAPHPTDRPDYNLSLRSPVEPPQATPQTASEAFVTRAIVCRESRFHAPCLKMLEEKP